MPVNPVSPDYMNECGSLDRHSHFASALDRALLAPRKGRRHPRYASREEAP